MKEMNCAEFEILLADSIDGVLPVSEQGALTRHRENVRSVCGTG